MCVFSHSWLIIIQLFMIYNFSAFHDWLFFSCLWLLMRHNSIHFKQNAKGFRAYRYRKGKRLLRKWRIHKSVTCEIFVAFWLTDSQKSEFFGQKMEILEIMSFQKYPNLLPKYPIEFQNSCIINFKCCTPSL